MKFSWYSSIASIGLHKKEVWRVGCVTVSGLPLLQCSGKKLVLPPWHIGACRNGNIGIESVEAEKMKQNAPRNTQRNIHQGVHHSQQ